MLQILNSTRVVGTSASEVQDFLKDIRALRNGIKKPYNFYFDKNDTRLVHGINYICSKVRDTNGNFHFIGYIDENAVDLINDFYPVAIQHTGGTEEKPTFGIKVNVYSKAELQTENSIFKQVINQDLTKNKVNQL